MRCVRDHVREYYRSRSSLLSGRVNNDRGFCPSPLLFSVSIVTGTVGLTEAEAIAQHGEGAIESYVSSFSPLEWSITDRHAELSSFAKVLVHKEQNNKVCGMSFWPAALFRHSERVLTDSFPRGTRTNDCLVLVDLWVLYTLRVPGEYHRALISCVNMSVSRCVLQVIGMHIASPNAAEVIQGFALAMKKGLTYEVSL
jgi:hypothetical protein